MGVIDKAVSWALSIANDDSHQYSQETRWGPHYDCSSMVITAYQNAGVPVKTKGATYTGNMRPVFLACGFKDVTNSVNLFTGLGLKKGDVLLNVVNHTAMSLGNGKIVHASGSANGICTRSYFNFPWDVVLRYTETSSESVKMEAEEKAESGWSQPITTVSNPVKGLPVLKVNSRGPVVKSLQLLLIGNGYSCGSSAADGVFGAATKSAVQKFQKDKNLVTDGEVGEVTWTKLIRG